MGVMTTGWTTNQDGLGCGGRGAIGAGTLTPAPVRATDCGPTGTREGARANVLPVAGPIGRGGTGQVTGGAGQTVPPHHDQDVAMAMGGRDYRMSEETGTGRTATTTAGANPRRDDHDRTGLSPKTIEGRRANADPDTCLAERDDWIVIGRFPVHMG